MKCKVRKKTRISKRKPQTVTVRLDSEQQKQLLDDLTQRIEWSTNRIVDETKPCYISTNNEKQSDGFSFFLKCAIGIPIIIFGIAVFYFLIKNGGDYWVQGVSSKFALVIMGILGLDCVLLGVEVLREKDRNYVVALFSALVSLVALIVALVK